MPVSLCGQDGRRQYYIYINAVRIMSGGVLGQKRVKKMARSKPFSFNTLFRPEPGPYG
nr:MAG TPA: hypothetical protein [Caudoviricetes sp.]